ncbi:MAG: ABC transporter permease [Thermoanaerobaculia bacterium]
MSAIPGDLRQAVRSLWRSPAYSLGILLTLATGIGLNAAGFGAVYGILLRPFDLPESGRLVIVWQDMTGRDGKRESWTGRGIFTEWREHNRSFEGMATFITFPADLTGSDLPEQIPGAVVSHEYFSVLGVEPALGRGFLPQEEKQGENQVAVLSYGLWHRRFGGDGNILGRTIMVNGAEQVVVGVLPEGFSAPLAKDVQLWSVLPLVPKPEDWGYSYVRVVGRLAPGATVATAEADLDRITGRLADEHPDALHGVGATVQPLVDAVAGPSRRLLLVLFGAGLLVLFTICINVASLSLARATTRRSELAVRDALGASRIRQSFQLLLECLVLAVGGAVLGIAIGAGCLALLRSLAPPQLPRLDSVHLDGSVFAFTLLLSLATGLLAGLLPALAVWRSRDSFRLGSPAATAERAGTQRLRSGLIVVEVALGLILMIGAGLLVRTLHNLSQVDVGFRTESLVLGRMTLAPDRFPEPEDRDQFLAELERRVAARPEVTSAGITSSLPLADSVGEYGFVLDGVGGAATEDATVFYRAVSPGFFRTLEVPLRAGRLIEDADTLGSRSVAVVNERFVERFLGSRNPVGQRIRIDEIDPESEPWRTIVGVVANVRGRAVDQPPLEEIYVPFSQESGTQATIVVRASGPWAPALETLQQEAARVRADQVVGGLGIMDEVVSEALSPRRFATALMGLFAVVVLILVVFGIYGVMSLAVIRRQREIAIRMAVGARVGWVIGRIMRWSGALLGGGVVLGIASGFATRKALSGLLYEVAPMDWVTTLLMAFALVVIGLAATLVPAVRAARIDPAETLKTELGT